MRAAEAGRFPNTSGESRQFDLRARPPEKPIVGRVSSTLPAKRKTFIRD